MPLPTRRSTLYLPAGPWPTVLECLCAHFPAISRDTWQQRIREGKVLDEHEQPIALDHPYKQGLRIYYFREVPNETPVPFYETVLYADEHLIVADKPHFLAVTPAGEYVEQTLLARLSKRFDSHDLVPLHRIDRLTAGLVLFSRQPHTRAAYQRMFAERSMHKTYEAIAPALPHVQFPHLHKSRMVAGEPFFLMKEGEGAANSETLMEVRERNGELWRYGLYPVTGKKHQLRLHLAALGAGICNDPFYPQLIADAVDDYSKPLKLLAQSLRFTDPLSGVEREFHSQLRLEWP
ncbi:MAG: pseudouridine synthase [Pseudomonas sp.]